LTSTRSRLPRLAFIADVAVERTGGGALLLYRLLKDYPPDRLLVVSNPELAADDPALQIPKVAYRPCRYRIPRLVRNRFNPAWPVVLAALMRRHARPVTELVRDFAPEAVLTVAHWYLWFTAAAVARTLAVPLHLVVYDDWPSYTTCRRAGPVWDAVRWACRRAMRRVFRQAVSRLCVSPGMEEYCQRQFGVSGTVLYPSWGEDSPAGRVRVRPTPGGPPVVAFCGMIHQDGTTVLLRKLAAVLAGLDGHLDLYTMLSADQLAAWDLGPPTVRVRGFFPAAEMGERIAQTSHALFLPASFEPRERTDVATLFPSKLTDYVAIGLPVLVWGPEYSSAVRWALENPRATILVTEPDPAALRGAVLRVATDPPFAAAVAAAGLAAGSRYFDLAVARQKLRQALGSALSGTAGSGR
jgi:glycosyltransferase involved in cell wall biosynthesis